MSKHSDEVIAKLHKDLGVKGSLEEFKMGINVEKEHSEKGPANGKFKVIPYKLEEISLIAAAHLEEIPDYYTRLKKMESEGKAAKKATRTLKDECAKDTDTPKHGFNPIQHQVSDSMNPERHEGAAEKDSNLKSKILRIRENLGEFLSVVNNQIIPDSKKNPEDFEAWRDIRELIKDLAISLDQIKK